MLYTRNFGSKGIVEIDLTCGSDYSGSLVEKCNYDEIVKVLSKKQYRGIYLLEGYYGGYGIGYIPEELTAKGKAYIDDIESALANYPLLNDDKHSEMEYNAIQEAFDDEYKSELKEYADSNDDIPEIIVDKAREIMSENSYGMTETGGVVYIDWTRILANLIVEFPADKRIYFDGNIEIKYTYNSMHIYTSGSFTITVGIYKSKYSGDSMGDIKIEAYGESVDYSSLPLIMAEIVKHFRSNVLKGE